MKHFALILMAFVFAVLPSVAQAPSLPSISIGDGRAVRVTLGESKESVLAKFKSSFDVIQGSGGDDEYYVQRKGTPEGAYDAIFLFENGRLSEVTKPWSLRIANTGSALAKVIYGAMFELTKSGNSCAVSAFDYPDPTTDKKGIRVSCGQRDVEISILSVNIAGQEGTAIPLVAEVIKNR